MFKHITKIAASVALALVLSSTAHSQSRWDFREIYSNADGSVQFIVLLFNGETAELPTLAGQTLTASDGNAEHSFTFASNAMHYFSDHGFDTPPCEFMEDGCWSYVLVGTQAFAELSLVKPDFVVPNGFLFASDGSVRLGVSESHYSSLPSDGENARWWNTGAIFEAEAINNAGESYVFMPTGINMLIEYYHAGLDDYFLTAYSSEIQYLDSGNALGWQRTGHALPAWTSPFSTGAAPPPQLASVCRLWLGYSHFYSISASECVQVGQYSGSSFESQAAFFATLPNGGTGACPTDQTRVYRLWNPRSSNHRYTIQTEVRDEMLSRGWLAEGYGPDSVAMCIGGNR